VQEARRTQNDGTPIAQRRGGRAGQLMRERFRSNPEQRRTLHAHIRVSGNSSPSGGTAGQPLPELLERQDRVGQREVGRPSNQLVPGRFAADRAPVPGFAAGLQCAGAARSCGVRGSRLHAPRRRARTRSRHPLRREWGSAGMVLKQRPDGSTERHPVALVLLDRHGPQLRDGFRQQRGRI
jgi:hypothetical protein